MVQKICNGCKFNLPSLCDKGMQDIVSCENGKEDASVIEQIPETFAELKELCKGMYADITEHSITLFGCLEFWDDGKLSFFRYADIVNNLKPSQMWKIIKSLME